MANFFNLVASTSSSSRTIQPNLTGFSRDVSVHARGRGTSVTGSAEAQDREQSPPPAYPSASGVRRSGRLSGGPSLRDPVDDDGDYDMDDPPYEDRSPSPAPPIHSAVIARRAANKSAKRAVSEHEDRPSQKSVRRQTQVDNDLKANPGELIHHGPEPQPLPFAFNELEGLADSSKYMVRFSFIFFFLVYCSNLFASYLARSPLQDL
jgi:hypothetical protein